MALEPITRQEKIIAGQDLTPITRLEKFLKNFGGGGGGDGGGGSAATTLHINVSAVNFETMEATFTADKTPTEMLDAAAMGPTWCVVTLEAGIFGEGAMTIGVPPAWGSGRMAFGGSVNPEHHANGSNRNSYFVMQLGSDNWTLDLTQFGG